MKKNYQKRLTVTIRPQLDKLLRGYCEETGRSMSYVVDESIERYINTERATGGLACYPQDRTVVELPVKGKEVEGEPLDPMRTQ